MASFLIDPARWHNEFQYGEIIAAINSAAERNRDHRHYHQKEYDPLRSMNAAADKNFIRNALSALREKVKDDDVSLYLEGLDLSGLDLSGLDVRMRVDRCDFRGTNLEGARLGGSEIFRCDFRETNLKGANLSKTGVSKSSFEGANLRLATLDDMNFEWMPPSEVPPSLTDHNDNYGIGLPGFDFEENNFYEADMRQVSAQRVKFAGKFNRANFGGSNLTESSFEEASLFNAKLEKVCLESASLKRADMSFTRISGSLENTSLEEACLMGASVSANVKGARFDRADIKGTNFRGAPNVKEASFEGAGVGVARFDLAVSILHTVRSSFGLPRHPPRKAELEGTLSVSQEESSQGQLSLQDQLKELGISRTTTKVSQQQQQSSQRLE